jgi:hypothetical protein
MDLGLKKGDRVRIAVEEIKGWEKFGPYATVTGVRTRASGAGSSEWLKAHRDSPDDEACYDIRLDGYDYGPSPTNCHTAHWSIINVEPNEAEMAEALASIAQAIDGSTHD